VSLLYPFAKRISVQGIIVKNLIRNNLTHTSIILVVIAALVIAMILITISPLKESFKGKGKAKTDSKTSLQTGSVINKLRSVK